jgi:aminopeptidase N
MKIHYYVLPDKLEKSKIDFAEHKNILTTFSNIFGEYPFIEEKYSVVEFLWTLGAMENQTVTGVSSSLITGNKFFLDYYVHELAHHWWGNAVGPKTWKDIWLNEGFSSYSEALYFESKSGKDALSSTMRGKYSKYFRGKLSDPGNRIFSNTVYDKGAWVLHMLRWEVGDSIFFSILKNYYDTYKYSNASTQEFISVAEDISAKDLTWFFHQWLDYEGGIKASYNSITEQIESGFKTKILFQQTQDQPDFYTFHLEVEFKLSDETTIRDIFLIDSKVSEVEIFTKDKLVEINLDPNGWLLGTFVKEDDSN